MIHNYFSWFMVFNATFNNNLAISWRSVLLVAKPENLEKTIDLPQATDKLYYIIMLWLSGIQTHSVSGDMY